VARSPPHFRVSPLPFVYKYKPSVNVNYCAMCHVHVIMGTPGMCVFDTRRRFFYILCVCVCVLVLFLFLFFTYSYYIYTYHILIILSILYLLYLYHKYSALSLFCCAVRPSTLACWRGWRRHISSLEGALDAAPSTPLSTPPSTPSLPYSCGSVRSQKSDNSLKTATPKLNLQPNANANAKSKSKSKS